MMSVPQVQVTARDYLLSKDIPLSGAVAITAVLYRESRLNPGPQGVQPSERGGIRNPHGAYGIASWNGVRQQDYTIYCDSRHLEYDVLENQLAFVLNEMANHYPLSWAATRSAASYDTVIPVIVDEYENPKDKAKEIRDAIVIANALAAVPPTIPSVPIPAPPPVPIPKPAPFPQAPGPTAPPSTSAEGHRATFRENVSHYRDFLITERDAVVAEFDLEISALEALASPMSPSLPPLEGKALMNQTKPAIASTGVWGSVISILVPILSQLADSWGHSVDPRLQAAGSILGGFIALYGRVNATTQITGVIKP